MLTHEASADRVFAGDSIAVTITATAMARLPLVELHDPLPSFAVREPGADRRLFGLGRGERSRWSYRVRCEGRRRLSLGAFHIRVWDPWGLRTASATRTWC